MNATNIILTILVVIFSILVCLTIHELGHFAFAKIFKVNVKEFSIGFGPVLWRTFTKKTNMQISLRLLPIGAYVLMDTAAIRRIYLDDPNAKKYNFYLRAKPYGTKLLEQVQYWKQMLIMFGGIFFNIIGFCLFLIIYSASNPNAPLDFANFVKSLFVGLGQSFVLFGLWPRPPSSGSGIPGFSTVVVNGDFLVRYLISINLATAIINIIPIAPLDGWKIMQLTYERITKKKLPEKLLGILSIIGVILVLWVTIGSIINQIVG